MRRLLSILLLIVVSALQAQTVWNHEHLERVKAQLAEPVYQTAYQLCRLLLSGGDGEKIKK